MKRVMALLRALIGRRTAAPQPAVPAVMPGELAARRARERALERQEIELLERRIELDGRRGPLAGDRSIDEALMVLEARFRSGEISEDQFEAEKIRLLTEG
ncbi:MAG: hypothetical protein ACRDFX_05165 [Chloroflexota bacterium]